MTHHVAHTNKMLADLKQQYQDKIDYLQSKIKKQEEEIEQLQTMLSIIGESK